VLCALRPAGAACITRVVTNGGGLQFGPVDDPLGALGHLLDHYWRGLQAPLSFFPRSGYAYVTEEDDDRRMGAALRCWTGGRDREGEGERSDEFYRLCYGGETDALPEDFVAVTEAILLAPLAARQDLDSRVAAKDAR
jgi:exodeoxyribonuclease V gamma subunit